MPGDIVVSRAGFRNGVLLYDRVGSAGLSGATLGPGMIGLIVCSCMSTQGRWCLVIGSPAGGGWAPEGFLDRASEA